MKKDLTGTKFGRWTVTGAAPNKGHRVYWQVVCDCGSVGDALAQNLSNGSSKSCGCIGKDPEFHAWKRRNLMGQRFGRLVIIGKSPSTKSEISKKRHSTWKVRCDCGVEKAVATRLLVNGDITSCGCEQYSNRKKTHGESKYNCTPEYRTWAVIKQRVKHSEGKIKISSEWGVSYEKFLEDMGRKPSPKHSLDRISLAGAYEASNCRWATQTQQMRNVSTNRMLTYKGQTKCLTEWAESKGMNPNTLATRLDKQGFSLEKAITAPVRRHRGRPVSGSQLSKSSEYRIWVGVRGRCARLTHPSYYGYGKLGIRVCERWLASFANFLEDMGKRPSPQHSLDRIDPTGNYSPENCRWADRKTQARNKRDTQYLVLHGVSKPVAEWAERAGLKSETVRKRLRQGWAPENVLMPLVTNRYG